MVLVLDMFAVLEVVGVADKVEFEGAAEIQMACGVHVVEVWSSTVWHACGYVEFPVW